jgi:hypothetical protein
MNNNYDISNIFNFFDYWKKYTQPTEFYNEGWLLKLLVFSVTDFGLKDHILFVNEKDNFFSEALLYSPFLARTRQDPFAETHTHADGAIGNFKIGKDKSKGSLHLIGNKLNVFEAKIYSDFSKNVSNAQFYNQVSRYVGCITETIDRANKIETINDLTIGFYLTIPEVKFINKKNFEKCLEKKHIFDTVKKRVEQYKDEVDFNKRKDWFEKKFTPVLEKIIIEPIFYETIISELEGYKYINEINNYYDLCLKYNK